MSVEIAMGAALIGLLGIGTALSLAGRRWQRPALLWTGVTVLVAVGSYIVVNGIFIVLCVLGDSC